MISERNFWLEAWSAANDYPYYSRRRREVNLFDFWGKMVDTFEQISQQDRLKRRIERTIHLLDKEQVELKGKKVLDIGCGIGDFSLAFASKGAEVTALEPAEPLLSRLMSRADKEKTANITPLQKEWGQANLEGDIKKGHFYLAFSSLNPGVRDPQALEAVISSSGNYCLLCDIASGSERSPSRAALWQEIFSEDMPPTHYNIIYPLGYLYSSGFHPSLETWTERWGESQPLEKAVSGALNFFSLYIEPDRSIRQTIENYFEHRSVNGLYKEEYHVRLGMILWKV